MLEVQVDVSGKDALDERYCIVAAMPDFKSYYGFKFNEQLVRQLKRNYESGKYHYSRSKTGKTYFKIRVYSIIVSALIRAVLKENKAINASLFICKDFDGHKENIEMNLMSLLRDIKIARFVYDTLPKESAADSMAYILSKGGLIKGKRFDKKRIIPLSLRDFELHLK